MPSARNNNHLPLINVKDPTNPQDAATKKYVDDNGGGGGTPGGENTQIQINDNGAFGGDDSFTWETDEKTLYLKANTAEVGNYLVELQDSDGVARMQLYVDESAQADLT